MGKLIRALPLFRDMSDVFGSGAAFARAIVNELADRYRGVARSLKNEKLRTGAKRLADCILQADALQGNRQCVENDIRQAHALLRAAPPWSGAIPSPHRHHAGDCLAQPALRAVRPHSPKPANSNVTRPIATNVNVGT